MQGEIIKRKDNVLTVLIHDEVDQETLNKNLIGGRSFVYVDPLIKDSMTELQRRHYFALVNDFSAYTGYMPADVHDLLKSGFQEKYNLDEMPSVRRGSMKKETASLLLEYVITFMIWHDIPFRKQRFYMTMDQSKMLYAFTMKRLCWICGEQHSDIHHATNLVGMGKKRSKHNHGESSFMCLCRRHHNQIHNIGLDKFCKDYHVYPIKLNIQELRELGVM